MSGKNKNLEKQSKGLDIQVADFIYWGMPASPSVPGYKSAAGSRVSAMLQKELPPVAFLQQRPHRLPSLRAFRLSTSRGRESKGVVPIQQN